MYEVCESVKDVCDACLHVESRARNAFVNLRVGLDEAPPHPPSPYHQANDGHRHRAGPSRQRRQERRERARKAAENVANGDSKAGEASDLSRNVRDKSTEKANGYVMHQEVADEVIG